MALDKAIISGKEHRKPYKTKVDKQSLIVAVIMVAVLIVKETVCTSLRNNLKKQVLNFIVSITSGARKKKYEENKRLSSS